MSTTTHPVTPEEIMALLDGEISGEQGESISRHMESCSECSEIAAPFVRGSQLLADWTVSPIPADSESSALDTAVGCFRSRSAVGMIAFLRRHWILTAASSAVVMTVTLFAALANRMTRPMEAMTAKVAGSATAADSNGVFHGLGDRAQNSFSVDGQPISDQQGKVFAAREFAGPMIARTISLSIIAKDFSTSRASLDVILTRHHGYAASLAANTEQDAARSLQASLRIPAAELTGALTELKTLGKVQGETQNGEEVTQQHADLLARLKNSRETELRLQDILRNRTGKISDVLAVEREIARVRGEIERMDAEQKNLEHRVDFATVDLRLSEDYKAQLGSPLPSVSTRFHNAFVSGYRTAAESIISFLLFFIEYGPSLLIWLFILAPMLWLMWRRWRRSVVMASSVS